MQTDIREAELIQLVEAAIRRHGARRDSLIPILSEINRALGYLPTAALPEIRRRIHVPQQGVFLADSHLYSAASFYQMFSLRPLGRHVVRYCESAPCHVVGAREVVAALQAELGLRPGETDPERRWSLLTTSCVGLCGVGPVFLVDGDAYGHVTPGQVAGILARYD